MSTNEWDLDDDELEEPKNGPKGLRDALKAAKEDLKSEREARQKLERQVKTGIVKEVLRDKGAKPQLARFILNDLDEVDEASVGKWLEDNGELFGFTETPSQEAEVDAGEVNEFQRMQQASSGSAGTPDGSALAKIAAAGSEEELRSALVEAGLA